MKSTTLPPLVTKIYSDRELIKLLKEGVQNQLHLAQHHFFQRFKGYVYKVSILKCRNIPDPGEFASEITQGVFRTVFKLTKSGKFIMRDSVPDAECKNIIKAWLGRIAKYQFKKEYYRHITTTSIDDSFLELPDKTYDLFESLYGEEKIEIPNEFRLKLREAMSKIKNERDLFIIETYADEGCINSKLHLSKNTMYFLCKLYDTTPDNIRQIKSRVLKIINSICFPTTK